MRIAALALSATLLSGCSWLGLGGANHSGAPQYSQNGRYDAGAAARYNAASGYQGAYQNGYQNGYQAPYQAGAHQAGARGGPCEITSVSHPIPQGCRPEQVTIALPGGSNGQYNANYAGQPNYAGQQPSYNAYGSAVDDAQRNASLTTNVGHNYWKRPKLRLTGSVGVEDSVSGDLYNEGALGLIYDPTDHFESTISGSPAAGQVILNEYYVANPLGTPRATNPRTSPDDTFLLVDAPTVNIGDAYTAPFVVALGGEYQLSDRFSVFGNVSYSEQDAEDVVGVRYEGNLENFQQITEFTEMTDPMTNAVTFTPNLLPATSSQFNNVTVAETNVELSDRRRTALEVGGRYYFDDIFTKHLARPLTPYVSAKVGAAYHNRLTATQTLDRLFLQEFATSDGQSVEYEDVLSVQAEPVEILDDEWIATGGLQVGAEWQITPRTALAFETGINIEGGRDQINGGDTNDHISVPLTLRGSFGF